MQRARHEPTPRTSVAVPEGMGAILLAGRSRDSVAGEVLSRARAVIPDAELWLLDRSTRRLRRPSFGGLQHVEKITLPVHDPIDSWPDPVRMPGLLASPSLQRLRAKLRGPVIARLLRSGDAPAQGLIVAPFQGRRPPASLDRSLAGIAAQAGAVLANHEALAAATERGEQLLALYETAHQLSSELDIDRVLAAICGQARALTGAEIAYIMLLDPARGDGYVRATDGVRTEAFKTVRLGIGLGLGGLVAKEGRPYYSSDYAHDARFVHVVDDAVAGESVVSVMGVPLKVADSVIGVLFAAYRRMTTFSGEDVAFLESLAEHASIALSNARLYEQARAALKRERRLHRIAEQQRHALEDINILHSRLTELALAEPNMNELLAAIGSALAHPVEFCEEEPREGVQVPVAAGPSILGWLSVKDMPDSLGDQEVRGLEQAARVVAIHLLRDRAVVQAQFQLRGEFLDKLLTYGEEARAELVLHAPYLGIDLSQPLAVLFIVAEEQPDGVPREIVAGEISERIARAFLDAARGSLVAGRFGGAVVLAPGQQPREFAKRLSASLAALPNLRLTVGFAAETTDVAGVGEAITEARRAVRGARALGRTGQVFSRDDLGVYGALVVDEGAELRTFAERLLGPIIEYDDKKGSDLCETLEVYLDLNCNATEAARRLYLHVNSLYYRLSRIRKLGGYNLEDPETRFELQLALRVLRVVE